VTKQHASNPTLVQAHKPATAFNQLLDKEGQLHHSQRQGTTNVLQQLKEWFRERRGRRLKPPTRKEHWRSEATCVDDNNAKKLSRAGNTARKRQKWSAPFIGREYNF
jgi:hypothetical protein